MSYGGSTGSSRISTAADAALNNLANGQVLTYNSSTQKWSNQSPAAGSGADFAFYRPEDYGAVGDGSTDDSAAFTACLAAASNASNNSTYTPITIMLKTGRSYRIANSITMPITGNITIDGNNSLLQGPINSAAVINSSNNPAVPAASDLAGQTAGACITDNGGDGAIYGITIKNLKFAGFRYAVLTKCLAWSYAKFENLVFYQCNIGVFFYQGAQEPRIIGCYSNGGTTVVAAATCFPSGHPYTGKDNIFCDGLIYDGIGGNRDSSNANATFDAWFKNAILRPTVATNTAGSTKVFGFTDADSLAVTGRCIYIPQRSQRGTFSLNVRRLDAEACPRGALLIGNPSSAMVENVSGENMFTNGPQAMVVLLLDNNVQGGTGTFRNIDASGTTNPSTFAIETRNGATGGVFDYAGLFAENVVGPSATWDDPFYTTFSHPAMWMHNPWTARMYFDKTNSTTTLANIDTMFLTTPAVPSMVSFKAMIFYTADSTSTGARFTVNGPAQSRLNYRVEQTAASGTRTQYEGFTSYLLPSAANTGSLVAGNIAIIEGQVYTTASGRFNIQFASGASGSGIKVLRGSKLEYIYTNL